MASFADLPPELVVVHIAPYLSNADLASLAKTSGALLRHLRHVRLYHLWQLYNRRYITDAVFREEVQRWIPVSRLVLVGWSVPSLPALAAFEGVHSAVLLPKPTDGTVCQVPSDLSYLRDVHTVQLGIARSIDWDALAGVRVLEIYGESVDHVPAKLPAFREALSLKIVRATLDDPQCLARVRSVFLSNCKQKEGKLTDLSPLQHATAVHLRSMHGVDVRALHGAREVSIVCCRGVVGLPPTARLRSLTWHDSPLTSIPPEFGSLHFLDLSASEELRDVAAARRVHTLVLRECDVGDISALSAVHSLELSAGPNRAPLDVSSLGRVHTLSLHNFEEIVGVALLDGVHELSLRASRFELTDAACRALGSCHSLDVTNTGVSDVSPFARVHTLVATYLEDVKGIAALAKCHSLNLSDCATIEDVGMLGRVHTLVLRRTHVTDVSALGGVSVLDLDGCGRVADVSKLGGVHTLALGGTAVADASQLGGVYDLCLSLTKVTDVSMLGGVHRLDLSHCDVKDVSALGRVHTLLLNFCPVTDVSGLERVCLLGVVGCAIADRRPLESVRHVVE